jgi:small conductance mechanosensitive channel
MLKPILMEMQKIVLGRGAGSITVRIVLIVMICWLVVRLLRPFLTRLERAFLTTKDSSDPIINKRVATIFGMFKTVSRLAIFATGFVFCLDQVGINVGPILAGAGIAGLVVGLGAQNLIRDLIAGFFMIMEGQIHIGDTAVLNGTEGLVETITFRTVSLRHVSGDLHIFQNGSITALSNKTCGWSAYVLDVGLSYKENVDQFIEQMRLVSETMQTDGAYQHSFLGPIEIFGVEAFGQNGFTIKARIKTKPGDQWHIGREYRRRLKNECDLRGISLTAPHKENQVSLSLP